MTIYEPRQPLGRTVQVGEARLADRNVTPHMGAPFVSNIAQKCIELKIKNACPEEHPID